MAEIDPLVVKIIADSKAARKDIADFQRMTGQGLARVERDVLRLESQMKRSSGAIGASLKGLAASFGAYFSGRELAGLLDSFTRLQNSLRVAGIEGDALKATQDRLFASAQKYGVEIEGLAGLYSTTSQAAKGFGAAQSDVFKVTDAVSAALKITGQSSQQASGALLQLGQAFRSPKVQAEEFNSLIDGMYPLLEAAAAGSERWGGSVTKLIADVKKGTVTGKEFFDAVASGSQMLEQRAAKATLTLSAGFTTLTNAMTVYFGEADKANGVSAALGAALKTLADNLDTLIPALAIIATGLGVGVATNALAARVAMLRASGAAVTLMGTAAGAGRALLAAFGGPVGVAITALVVGLGYLAANTEEAARAAREAEIQSVRTAAALDSEKRVTDALAEAKGREREATIASIKASRDRALQARQTSAELIKEARASLAAARASAQEIYSKSAGDTGFLATLGRGLGGVPTTTPGTGKANRIDMKVSAAEQKLQEAEKRFATLQGEIDGIASALGENNAPVLPDVTGGTAVGKKGARTGAGSDPLDAAFRNAQDLRQLQIEELRAKENEATAAEEKADLARQGLALEAEMRRADIAEAVRKKQLTGDEAKARLEIIDRLYGAAAAENEIVVRANEAAYQREISRREQEQIARQQTDAMRDELDALRSEADITDVRTARVAIERNMLEIQQAIERSLLEEAIARGDVADAAKARAALARKQDADRTGFERDNQGPLDRYAEEIRRVGLNMNDEFERVAVSGLRSLNDGLADAIANSKNLGDVFKNVARQIIADLIRIAIQQTIVNSLMGAIGGLFGGGGGLSIGNSGSSLKSVFKVAGARAGGGPVAAGSLYRINESGGPGNPEYFRPAMSGNIIPLGSVNKSVAQPGAVQKQPIELRIYADEGGTFVPRVEAISAGVTIQVQRQIAPGMIDAAANEAMRRAGRPKL